MADPKSFPHDYPDAENVTGLSIFAVNADGEAVVVTPDMLGGEGGPGEPDLRTYGAEPDSTVDCTPALAQAKNADLEQVRLPVVPGSANVYRFTAPTSASFTGLRLAVDPDVTVSVPGLSGNPDAQYSTLAAMRFASPTKVQLRDVSTETVFPADPNPYTLPQMPPMDGPARRSYKLLNMANDVVLRRLTWPATGDDWQDVAPSAANATAINFDAITGSFVVAFTSLAVGETVHMMLSSFPAGGAIGVFYRGRNGMAGQFDLTSADGAPAYNFGKLTGQNAVVNQDIDYPNRTVNSVFRFANSLFSVTRIARDRVTVRINGQPFVLTGFQTGNIGDIQEVGVGYYTSGNSAPVTVKNYVLENNDTVFGSINLKGGILIGGDSTAERMGAMTWGDRAAELLEGASGMQVGPIVNLAVVSTTAAQVFNRIIPALDTAGASIVAICASTNDIQGQLDRGQFTATWENGLDAIIAKGRIPFVMIPYIWYSTGPAGNTGYATSGADRGAWYRAEIMRICVSRGVRYADIPAELGNPEPGLRNDPRGGYHLRDNIHQTAKAHALYARAFARMVLAHFSTTPRSYTSSLWPLVAEAGVTPLAATGGVGYEQDATGRIHLWGYIDVTNIGDGATWLRLPRHLRPGRTVSFFLPALNNAGTSLAPQGRVDIGVDGIVRCYGMPGGTYRVSLDPIHYLPAAYAIG